MPKLQFTVRFTPKSSNIWAIAYSPTAHILRIQFRRDGQAGQVYEYLGVQPEAAQALIDADSVGSHFSSHIRKQFQGSKVATLDGDTEESLKAWSLLSDGRECEAPAPQAPPIPEGVQSVHFDDVRRGDILIGARSSTGEAVIWGSSQLVLAYDDTMDRWMTSSGFIESSDTIFLVRREAAEAVAR